MRSPWARGATREKLHAGLIHSIYAWSCTVRSASTVPDINALRPQVLLTEVCKTLMRFPTAAAFCSSLRLWPEPRISGGQVLSSETRPPKNRAAVAGDAKSLKLTGVRPCAEDHPEDNAFFVATSLRTEETGPTSEARPPERWNEQLAVVRFRDRGNGRLQEAGTRSTCQSIFQLRQNKSRHR